MEVIDFIFQAMLLSLLGLIIVVVYLLTLVKRFVLSFGGIIVQGRCGFSIFRQIGFYSFSVRRFVVDSEQDVSRARSRRRFSSTEREGGPYVGVFQRSASYESMRTHGHSRQNTPPPPYPA